jgi:hypothetical protein
LFWPSAVDQIAFYSGGIPRLINIICDNALLLAYAGSKNKVTTEMIREVARDLGLETLPQPQTATSPIIVESTGDEPSSSVLTSSKDAVDAVTQISRRQKSRLAWIPIGLSLALIGIGGAGGAFYSRQIKGYLQQAPAPEYTPISNQSVTNEISRFSQANTNIALNQASGNIRKPHVELEAITSKTRRAKIEDSQIDTKKKESSLGMFEVTGPFSFVRAAPRSDAKIIATLQPLTRLNVMSMRGNYFRIQTTVDGRTIRGYVHREDAFFDRLGNGAQRKSRIQ